MKYLEFKVGNLAITRSSQGDKTSPISGSVNYFGVQFEFDEDFDALAGAKAVEFYKSRATIRKELVDGKCLIPNEMLKNKEAFDMRVIVGISVATPWISVAVAESGQIAPEEPAEEVPESMEYVKTQSGDGAVPYIREGEDGLEYSQNGKEWKRGVSGVPEVPSKKKNEQDEIYGRKNGDWVPIKEYLEGGGEANIIEAISINGVELPVEEKSVNIDLSAYAKTEDIETLHGEVSQLTSLDSGETDTAVIVAKINEVIAVLRSRGITTA